MQKNKKLNLIGQLLLFFATLAWGTSFVILKDTIEEVPAMYVIAIRFLIAGIVMALIFYKKLLRLTKVAFFSGVVVGVMVALAYITQTIGLMNTTPGRNAFITSSYCVMTPFLMWIFSNKKPKVKNVISAVICIIGIGLISLSGESSSGENLFLGDGLTLISAIFFGLQIVYIDKFQGRGVDSAVLLIFEFLTAGVIFILTSLIFELPQRGINGYALNLEQLLKIVYLTLACTLFAQSAQMIGQKFTTANQSAIILSLEAVFGMLFSVIMGVEKLSIMLGIGFAVVFIAIMISEINFDGILRKRAGAFEDIKNKDENNGKQSD